MSSEAVIVGGLLERDGELRRLRRVIDAAVEGEGSVTVIAAPAGLGKTKLLEAAVEEATAAGLRPLVGHASELEREFAFGLARQPARAGRGAGSRERRAGSSWAALRATP